MSWSRRRAMMVAALTAVLTGAVLPACRTGQQSAQRGGGTTRAYDDRPSPIVDKLPQPEQDKHLPAQLAPGIPPASLRQVRAGSGGPADWAIIAATYKSFNAARSRATQLKSAWGACACSVYPQDGEGQNYYVLVGSGLTRDAADLQREQAVGAGLPGDTYVTKLVSRDLSSDGPRELPAP